ncbi:WD40 domain-containing protein [Microdochium bolleyi]|uniref:WD40 domain-containing protein n=1 Tax=Microdochium bolleyi TaxID=196109 RepID=A0A136JAN3_9PEZI|nr:WD40 domain-containing protein [Microdochium bolleyi]
MLFSRVFRGSPHCLPSPDGELVATLLPSSIAVRQAQSLQLAHTIRLPAGLSGGIIAFAWSPSSSRILVAVFDQVHVFSVLPNDNYHAAIRLATSSVAKPTLVTFGATDHEIFVFSTHGIKLLIFNLLSSSTVEIGNPKFYTTATAARGFSLRPSTKHLALLTRTAGKDLISIHPQGNRELKRSWTVETVDAQGLLWTPDGNWLLVWESAAHGHKLLYYTSDGHLFKEWHGPKAKPGDIDLQLGAGIGLLKISINGDLVAIADSSRSVTILTTSTMKEMVRLAHAEDICPSETLQVWQEQSSSQDHDGSTFSKAVQTVAPPSGSTTSPPDAKSGPNLIAFDCSSNLLATRLSSAPSTIWIWDLPSAELRAVIVYHSDVAQVQWHPKQPELLLMRCDTSAPGVAFVWDPLSQGPRAIDIASRMKTRKISGKMQATWLDRGDEMAAMLFGDDTSFGLCLTADSTEESDLNNWFVQDPASMDDNDSFLSLGPGDARNGDATLPDDFDDDHSEMDDTFHFKKQNTP